MNAPKTSVPPQPRQTDLMIFAVIFAVLFGVLVLGLCCVVIFLASSPAEMEVLAPTSIATCPGVPAGWEVRMSDTFDTDEFGWEVGTYEGELGYTESYYQDDKYVIKVNPLEGMVHRQSPSLPMQGDFYLTMDAQITSGPDSAYYGAYFRFSDDHYYYFAVSDTQEYAFWLRVVDWDTLVDWTLSPAIKPGDVNRLTIYADGSYFVFCINDQWVNEVYDPQKTRGYLGVAVGVETLGVETVFEFDNFVIYAPPK